jgi:hypothetical protein
MNVDAAFHGEELPFIHAMLGYSADIARARTDLVEPALTNMPQKFVEAQIYDARGVRDQLDLEREGFMLVDHKTAVTDFSDTEQFGDTYLAEMIDVLRDVTTADIFVPARKYLALRQPAVGDHDIDYIKAPSNLVHMDFTQGSFANLVQLTLEEAGRGGEVFSRVALYQMWRPLSDPPEDFPFALVDSRSTSPDDFIVMDNIIGPTDTPGNVLQTRLGLYRPEHRWYWFSNMTQDELVVFKGNDTRFGDAQCVFHAAFDNRPNAPGFRPRYSVEARIFAFWN